MATEEELHSYLQRKGVKRLLEDLLEDILQQKPEEPIKHIYNYIRQKYPSSLTSPDVDQLAGELEQLLSRNAPVDYPLDDDEDPQDQDDSASEPELPPPPPVEVARPAGRNRRKSISAEPVNPDDLKSIYVPKVYPKNLEEKRRLIEVISHNILFAGLDQQQKGIILDAMFEVNKEPGEVIIRQGDEGDNFYVVDTGECEVYVAKNGGEAMLMMTCGPGQSFGELALMYNSPRAATVKARTPTRLWAVDRITFKFILMDTTIKQRTLYDGFLEKIPLLANLSRYERLQVADALVHKSFKQNEAIIREGEPGDCFYIIEQGEVVCKQTPSPGNPQVEVGRLRMGDYFGEIALLTNRPRAATVIAVTDVNCLTLTRNTFIRLLGPLQDILKRNISAYKSYISLV
mmetsp:Transcript_36740/g.59358  ORF Transcript_36740/g.59358 Transcript_36740/m.59358 type:complete len:402 (+) Transcript_36740:90-1295(+)|eukprot:CAMPEP_0184657692 /NCGR_PEP_ID=MMETSP0308-20130426/21173_1 /TAXON_ID=38269 /ORGANISM="Gloeochaete witrockiana, Strain SAG 46.84" /LENGTH=401 /DNA_ID=CAMNT_0027095825 /DNA_START=54 /DNA_END=1262 /DNA_ORIENTATION=+